MKACLASEGHGFDNVKEIVDTFEHPQFFYIRRLNAVTEAVDPNLSQLKQVFIGDCARIRFHRNFCIIGEGEVISNGLENNLELLRAKERGSSSTEKDSVDFFLT